MYFGILLMLLMYLIKVGMKGLMFKLLMYVVILVMDAVDVFLIFERMCIMICASFGMIFGKFVVIVLWL